METRANYALIGLFTLAVIAAGFGFVMWFSGAEKQGGRETYKIIFTGSVSGLSVGGWVLFNGVRVGEVSKIDLMPQDPSRVYALIKIDSRVPVHTDTKAQLEYTFLNGLLDILADSRCCGAINFNARFPPIHVGKKNHLGSE